MSNHFSTASFYISLFLTTTARPDEVSYIPSNDLPPWGRCLSVARTDEVSYIPFSRNKQILQNTKGLPPNFLVRQPF